MRDAGCLKACSVLLLRERRAVKLQIGSLFDAIDSIFYAEQFEMITKQIDVSVHEVILIKTCDGTIPYDFSEEAYGVIEIDDSKYEFTCVISVSDVCARHKYNWVSNMYARHGGNHKSWWTQCMNSNIGTQAHNF